MKRIKRGYGHLENPLYLNANLVYSEALKDIRKPHWNRDIKTGILEELMKKGYHLVTSVLTRMEVIQRLSIEENIRLNKAREVYQSILNKHQILEITSIHHIVHINDAFIDKLATSNLEFRDALHLAIAKSLRIPLCTHDKKIRGNFSNHEQKTRFYDEVFKPQDLLEKK